MNKVINNNLYKFATESDHIENIHNTERHLTHYYALETFLKLEIITVADLERFVRTIEPQAFLRTKPEHQVWIGGHEAIAAVHSQRFLLDLLEEISSNNRSRGCCDPYTAHIKYENIHPFIDGNGRSGRALWLWMMLRDRKYVADYLFLRMWYYQTLAHNRGV